MDRREVDFMIVGQGLAGSQLAAMLRRENRSVLVVDNGNPSAASRVNLGLMNPVTGRKLKLAWNVDQVFPFAEEWYRSLEQELGIPLFEKKNLIRFFIDEKQKRVWEEKKDRPEFQPYLAEPQQWEAYLPYVHAPLGGVEITGAALVNVEGLLARWREILLREGALVEATLNPEDIELKNGRVVWQDVSAEKIIFCEGFRAVSNPFFSWLPFSPVKGEAIVVHIPDLPAEKVLHRGIFVRPEGGGQFRVGATHLHRDFVEIPTEAGIEQLKSKLSDFIRRPFEIRRTMVGIRPTTSDTRPVIGLHPEHPEVGIFNGLGSKGVSMSPYATRALVDFVLRGRPIDPELDVRRFWQK